MASRCHGPAIHRALRIAALLVLTGAVACAGSDGSGADGADAGADADTDGDTDADADPEFECPAPLAPLPEQGQVEVVGDGSAASCDAAALGAAVETLRGVADGGTIRFDCGGAHTIALAEPLFVDFPLLIDGEHQITLSGNEVTRVIELDNHAELAVQRLTIADGLADESGAGILHPWYGTLTAIDVRFENNHCTSLAGEVGGGAVFAGGLDAAIFSGCEFVDNSASNGGGLFNRGSTLTVIDCVFTDNVATSSADGGQFGNGGGLYIDGMNYDDPGDLYLCGTAFERNSATQHGSAVFAYFYEGSRSYVDRCRFIENDFDGSPTGGAGGLYHQAVPLTLRASTFADNRSDAHAAGLFIGSGSSAQVINCTFSGNRVPEVGAAIFDGASPLAITNCTFAGNEADYGPAIFKGEEAAITVAGTIFAENATPNEYSALACHEPLTDGGGNLQWPDQKPSGSPDTPCVEGITFADPLLGPLADNGGPTPTLALDAASPAVDLASGCPATDQRGVARGEPCDSGSYERED